MNLVLHIVLYIAITWIAFNVIYGIVCRGIHTSIRYRLFALRDRLRRIRIEHPLLDREICEMMELKISGCIGLVAEASLHRLLLAVFAGSYSQKEKDRAKKMQEAIKCILDGKVVGLDEQPDNPYNNEICDIEKQTMEAFRDSFIYNSPFASIVMVPIVRFYPSILNSIELGTIEKSLRVRSKRNTHFGFPILQSIFNRYKRVNRSRVTGRMGLFTAFVVALACYAKIINHVSPEEYVPTMIVHYALK